MRRCRCLQCGAEGVPRPFVDGGVVERGELFLDKDGVAHCASCFLDDAVCTYDVEVVREPQAPGHLAVPDEEQKG